MRQNEHITVILNFPYQVFIQFLLPNSSYGKGGDTKIIEIVDIENQEFEEQNGDVR